MRTRAFLFTLAIAFGAGTPLAASEEEILPWSEVRIAGPERKDTGTVAFAAKAAGNTFQEVRIEAFGKAFTVAKEDLPKLAGFPLNSLVITHEAGYERLGGHTVHFKMKRLFSDPQKRLIEERIILSVSRGKGLSIAEPTQQVVKEAN
jgi:hypothetical protein